MASTPKIPWHHDGRSRHQRGYNAQWVKTRSLILRRDGYLCQPCLMLGRPTQATEVDHVVPKANGGSDEWDNLQSICRECHSTKTSLESAEAQGRKPKQKRLEFDASGHPIWPE